MKHNKKPKLRQTWEGWAAFYKEKRISRFFFKKESAINYMSFLLSR